MAKADRRERPAYTGDDGARVTHPTVKPLALIEHLMALLVPPGGRVLDPFAGSGPVVEVALRRGIPVTAIERDGRFLPLIGQRVARAS